MTFSFPAFALAAALFSFQNSFATQTSHPPFNAIESKQSYQFLWHHLIARFQLADFKPKPRPAGFPAESEAVQTLTTADCTIRFRLIETYYKNQDKPSQNILIHVEPTDLPQGQYTWFPVFQMTEHSVQQFQKLEAGFIVEEYTDSCEEEGCDDNWYVAEKLVVTKEILQLQQTEPYSTKVRTYTCHF